MYRVRAGLNGFPEVPCLRSILKEMEELVWRQKGIRYSSQGPDPGDMSIRGLWCRVLERR